MKYRRIIPVDARQLPPLTPGWHQFDPLGLDELAEWCGGQKRINDSGSYIVVPRFAGDMRAWPGDWIVQDIPGRFCKVEHQDFASSFEPIGDLVADGDGPLLDPDCRDNKCTSCVGGLCECSCHLPGGTS